LNSATKTFETIISSVENLTSRSHRSKEIAISLVGLSSCYELLGKFTLSLDTVNKAFQHVPDSLEAREQRIQLLFQIFGGNVARPSSLSQETLVAELIGDLGVTIETRKWELARLDSASTIAAEEGDRQSTGSSMKIAIYRMKLLEAHTLRGYVMYQLKYTGSACQDFQWAVEIQPSELLMNFIGGCHRDFGEGKLALKGETVYRFRYLNNFHALRVYVGLLW
jgi:hypothetical protein